MFFADRNFLGKQNTACGIRPRVTVPLPGHLEDPGGEIAKMAGGFPSQTAFHLLQYKSLQVDCFDVPKTALAKSRQQVKVLESDGSDSAWKV